MRATLLASNPAFAAALPGLFDAVDIPLTTVDTLAAIRRAVRHASSDDFVIVDCSLNCPDDWARCVEVMRSVGLAVHVIMRTDKAVYAVRAPKNRGVPVAELAKVARSLLAGKGRD
ncbi:MAG: hypothetical protein ACRD1G_19120 [Acidimicrobiales bacterium]